MTEDVENFKILDFPCKLIKISIYSKFKEYQHKDFLGSLMGLNIKRELMGDLILEMGLVIFLFLADCGYNFSGVEADWESSV